MKKNELRNQARGRPCEVRIALECGYFCASNETTVLAHLTMPGLKGMGRKVPDLLGAWACDTCHGLIDGRLKPHNPIDRKTIKLWHHEAVARTLAQLIAEGVIES